jgi:ABC-type phosphate/phosphonate transport system substrate-binding protein
MRTVLGILLLGLLSLATPTQAEDCTLHVVVMDPLSAPLSCDCVKGYAQRKYEKLGDHLAKTLARPVKVTWAESLVKAVKETGGLAQLVIGKHSVVLHDAAKLQRKMEPIAALSGAEGETTQTGLLVVRTSDPAKGAGDLAGYRIFFGPEDCDEKSAVIVDLLKAHNLPVPTEKETCPACSNAAAKLMELKADDKAVAVISSYAERLLEGCGTVKKGDLRVIARSKPVPFITAFADASLSTAEQETIKTALLAVAEQVELLEALETEAGFVPYEPIQPDPAVTSGETTSKKK